MINVFDSVMTAVEQYNDYVRGKNLKGRSYEELRGLFYNFLRTNVCYIINSRFCIPVDSLVCKFNQDKMIESYNIKGDYYLSGSDVIIEVVELGKKFPVLYPTRSLNEMSRIIKLLKP